jgi:arsenate reductase
MTDITICHNPNCGTSRNTLAMIRNSGVEPCIVHYKETPPGREELVGLIAAMNVPVRDVLRHKGTPCDELDLDNPKWSDAEGKRV